MNEAATVFGKPYWEAEEEREKWQGNFDFSSSHRALVGFGECLMKTKRDCQRGPRTPISSGTSDPICLPILKEVSDDLVSDDLDLVSSLGHYGNVYSIVYARGTDSDLANIRVHDRKRILDRLEEQLTHEPTTQTRNRKPLLGLIPPWDHELPIWELRIGEYRAFYDVNEDKKRVIVRAVRRKQAHQKTEDIL